MSSAKCFNNRAGSAPRYNHPITHDNAFMQPKHTQSAWSTLSNAAGLLLSVVRPSDMSYLDGELPLGEVRLALLGLLQNPRGVLGGQAAADGAGLLGPEVKGQVLLVLVEEAELSTLLRVDDGEDAGDRLADIVAIREKKPHVSQKLPVSSNL